jgi:hypothetical protein
MIAAELHPWPPLLALVMDLDSTDVVSLIDSTGLVVEWALSGNDDYSNKTRKRAYRPRLDAAFRSLDDSEQLRAAWILTRELLQRHPEYEEQVRAKLAEIGWRIDAGTLVPSSSPIRELLFMQGTEYDSYRAIKRVIQEAKQCVAVVDPYLDGTIFAMLATSSSPTLSVKLLTAKAGSSENSSLGSPSTPARLPASTTALSSSMIAAAGTSEPQSRTLEGRRS